VSKSVTIAAGLAFVALATIASAATAQTWEENLEKGAATTERNHLNDRFTLKSGLSAKMTRKVR